MKSSVWKKYRRHGDGSEDQHDGLDCWIVINICSTVYRCVEPSMAKNEGEVRTDTWISVNPVGLWEVKRRWMGERKRGDSTPLLGSVCRIRVGLKNHAELETQSLTSSDTEQTGRDDCLQVTDVSCCLDSVLQIPLDRWIMLRMGEGQCDIVEGCLEGMRAGETCEFTMKACQGDSKPVLGDATQSERTSEKGQSLASYYLQLHSFSPGQESWQMSPAEKWSWVLSHKQRGSQRFTKGDIWGAAHCYCCAVKLVITLKGHIRVKERSQTDVDGSGVQGKVNNLATQDDKGKINGEKEVKGTHIPNEDEYRTVKAELHSNLSLCQLRLGQPAKAKDSSSKATALDPASIKAWYRLGQACMQLDDFEQARQAFGKVIELQPDSAAAHNALKQVNVKAKEFDNKLRQRLSKMFT